MKTSSEVLRRDCLLLLIVLTAGPAAVAQVLRGTVVQKENGLPLAFANIFLKDTRFGTTSDTLGRFQIADFPSGTYVVEVRLLGYKPNVYILTSDGTESTTLNALLEVDPIKMKDVEITSEAERIKQLANHGNTIITSDQITRTGTKSLATYLKGQYPGLFPSVTRRTYERLRFVLYVNGALVQYTPEILDTMIDVEEVDFIEVYKSFGMTPTRDRGSNERVIHIHTKIPDLRR